MSLRKEVTIKYKKEIKLVLNDPEHIRYVEKRGLFLEHWMLLAIEKMDLSHGYVLDIGANCGNHSVFFSTFCNQIGVMSFEPFEDSYKCLEQNMVFAPHSKCKNHLFNCAVGSKDGKAKLIERSRSGINGISKDVNGDIELNTIDSLCKDTPVSLMKIDVEGMEIDVLKGAKKTIKAYKPELFIETKDPDKILAHLPKGYRSIKQYNNSPTWYFSANN